MASSKESASAASTTRLTKDRIIAAGGDLIEQLGPDRLTMRALAEELGVTATALYYYFTGREELLEAVVDANCVVIVNSLPAAGTWAERLRTLMTAIAERGTSHPAVVALSITRYAKLSPVVRLHEAILGVLAEGGFTPSQSVEMKALLFRYVVGHQTIGRVSNHPDASETPDEEFINYRAASSAHANFDRTAHFQHGLDVIFAGFASIDAALPGFDPDVDRLGRRAGSTD